MDPLLVLAVGLLCVLVVVLARRMRGRYERQYGDEEAFFESRYPAAWGLVAGARERDADDAGDDDHPRCPDCGAANDPAYTYCHACNHRLPAETE